MAEQQREREYESETEKESERERSSICWLTIAHPPKMAAVARVGQGWSQEPEARHSILVSHLSATENTWPSSIAFTGTSAGSWIG